MPNQNRSPLYLTLTKRSFFSILIHTMITLFGSFLYLLFDQNTQWDQAVLYTFSILVGLFSGIVIGLFFYYLNQKDKKYILTKNFWIWIGVFKSGYIFFLFLS